MVQQHAIGRMIGALHANHLLGDLRPLLFEVLLQLELGVGRPGKEDFVRVLESLGDVVEIGGVNRGPAVADAVGLAVQVGLQLVGPLPEEIQNYTAYTAARVATTTQHDAAIAFLLYLASPDGKALFAANGIR